MAGHFQHCVFGGGEGAACTLGRINSSYSWSCLFCINFCIRIQRPCRCRCWPHCICQGRVLLIKTGFAQGLPQAILSHCLYQLDWGCCSWAETVLLKVLAQDPAPLYLPGNAASRQNLLCARSWHKALPHSSFQGMPWPWWRNIPPAEELYAEAEELFTSVVTAQGPTEVS